MWCTALTLVASLGASAALAQPAPARVAVLIDDPGPSQPMRAALETQLQALGYEVVSREQALEIRRAITPQAVLEGRLPADLSVLEADAILAGEAAYGEANDVEGTQSLQVALSARLLDLATSKVSATQQTSGVGLGVRGPNLAVRGAQGAVKQLFERKPLLDALGGLGQQAGAITLVIQGLPSRTALAELRAALERSLGGAPVREIYFAQGLGKLLLGGSAARSMNGPDVANVLTADKSVALTVAEVANTRIVATYDRARTVSLRALVLEPSLPPRMRAERTELGRYVTGEVSKFGFVQGQYQPTPLNRNQARARAKALKLQLIVESEVLTQDGNTALSIRMIDVDSGEVILREQTPLPGKDGNRFQAVETVLGSIKAKLPEHLASRRPIETKTEPAVAAGTDPR